MRAWKPQDIKRLRSKHKLSQTALAEQLGISGNYIYLLEKGEKKPSKTLRLLLDCVENKLKRKGGNKNA